MSDEKAAALEVLATILEPLGAEVRAELVKLADEYLDDYAPIQWCMGRGDNASGEPEAPLEWEVAKPSPLNPDFTVFALFHWAEGGAVVALSFRAILREDQTASAEYRREVIFEPRFATGPISLSALALELRYHLQPEDREGE